MSEMPLLRSSHPAKTTLKGQRALGAPYICLYVMLPSVLDRGIGKAQENDNQGWAWLSIFLYAICHVNFKKFKITRVFTVIILPLTWLLLLLLLPSFVSLRQHHGGPFSYHHHCIV
jgi:hypothetical protein